MMPSEQKYQDDVLDILIEFWGDTIGVNYLFNRMDALGWEYHDKKLAVLYLQSHYGFRLFAEGQATMVSI